MKNLRATFMQIRKPAQIFGLFLSIVAANAQTNAIPNRLIDYQTFLTKAGEVGRLRAERRVTEEQFISMAAQPDTVVFDARSDDKYQRMHIKGAKHLDFTEITADNLAKVIPSRSTKVLIYCNNNFLNEPAAFATKAPAASLNIHTFNTLVNYGYTNVYELGPLVDVRKTKLEFEGTLTRLR
jgi:rhodanese-related sulfurtransferase